MRHSVSHLSLSNKLIVVCLILPLIIGQSGCAVPKPYALPPPLSEAVREKLGTIGIVSADFTPKAEICKPMGKGAGAATGAGEGAAEMILGGASTGDPFGLLLGVVLAPVGATVGAVAGTVKGVPAKQRKKAEDAINKAVSELKIQSSMRDCVLRVAQHQTQYHFVLLDVKGSKTAGSKADYRILKNKGVDTVLEITVSDFGLWAASGINPPLVFFMKMQARLIRTMDCSLLYKQNLEYRSAKFLYTEWAANDAKLLREEFDRCYLDLAEKLVEQVFMVYNLPSKPSPRG